MLVRTLIPRLLTSGALSKSPNPKHRQRDLVQAANAARDRQDWREAAALYDQVLDLDPSLHPIRVQLGHMLKEMGDLDAADRAYASVLVATPNDGDLHLQMGHLRKLQGDITNALYHYKKALKISPKNKDAKHEYNGLKDHYVDGSHTDSALESGGSISLNVALKEDQRYTGPFALSPAQLRAAGDQARDARAWSTAARHYGAYLKLAPKDVAIWIQLGHALKESGDLSGGEAAYRKALEQTPEDADLHLQLGSVLKLQGQRIAAVEAYRRCFSLEPLRAAAIELRELDPDFELCAPALRSVSVDTIYLEISDLLEVLSRSETVSGIQRVQLGLLTYVLNLRQSPSAVEVRIVAWWDGGLWQIRFDLLSQVIRSLNSPTDTESRSRLDLLNILSAHSLFVVLGAGDTLVETGATWLQGDLTAARERLKHTGVRIGACIYDFIPLTHPEYCHSYLTERFSNSVSGALLHLDFALAISESTRREMKRLLEQGDYPEIPCRSVALAQEVVPGGASEWTPAISELHGREYVLCVGTLHAHKNHLLLLQVWRLLLQGGVEPPTLVIAGVRGHGVGDLFSQLEATGYFGGLVRIIEGLTDGELATLYRNCLFTVFPSIVEGWGLPVGESLAYGKVCVASSTSSIPEVGGSLAIYFDPFNARSAVEAIANLVSNRTALAQHEAEIRQHFKPRSWQEYGEAFLRAVTDLADEKPASAVILPIGKIIRPRERSTTWRHGTHLPPRAALIDDVLPRLSMIKGWHPPETWGSWMAGKDAHLGFTTELPAGAVARVLLQFRTLPWLRRNRVTVRSGCGTTREMSVPFSSSCDFLFWMDCTVLKGGRVDLILSLDGSTAVAEDPRELGIGLVRLLYLRQENPSDTLPPAVLCRPTAPADSAGNAVIPRDLAAFKAIIGNGFMLTTGWKPLESWGACIDAPTAGIAFYTNIPAGTLVRVAVQFEASPEMAGALLAAQSRCRATATLEVPKSGLHGQLLWLDCRVGAEGRVSLTIQVTRTKRQNMPVSIGLLGLVYGPQSTVADRLNLSEALLFPRPASTVDRTTQHIQFTVTGHVKGSYSLASVNRRLVLAIESARPGDVRLEQAEGKLVRDLAHLPSSELMGLRLLADRPHNDDGANVVISQHWPVWVPRQPGDLLLAYIFWEESLISQEMTEALNSRFRGVLASSRSVVKALVDSGVRIPVYTVGFAPDLTNFASIAGRRPTRRAKPITSSAPFIFLHVSSCFPRKGVDVLLNAYRKAFRRSEPVKLVVKGFANPHNSVRSQLTSMVASDPDMPPVELIEHDLQAVDLLELYETADTMVLPTRGEGYNIPAAEALAAGVPLIVTGFGGHTDFVTPGTSRLIDFHFAPSGSHLASPGSVWADPNLDALADTLREAFDQALKIETGDDAALAQRAEQVANGRACAERLADTKAWVTRICAVAQDLLSAPLPAEPAVAWVSTWNVRCGIAEYSRMLLAHYGGATQKLTVLCDERTTGSDLKAIHNWLVTPAWRVLDPRSVDGLAQAIDDTGASLVVIQHHPGLINWPELSMLLTDSRLVSRKVIVVFHNVRDLAACDPRRLPEIIATLNRASRLLVHTVRDLNLLKTYGLVENVTLFPHGADQQDLATRDTRLLLPGSDPLIGSYGFFLPHKGFAGLIRVFSRLRGEWPRARLRLVTAEYPAIISSNELAECRALASSLGLDGAIEWHTTFLENERSLQLLNECDLVVLPYQDTLESSSAAVRNAISSRAPVAVTPIEIFDDVGEAVLRLSGISEDSITADIAEVLYDAPARRRVQIRAGRWLEEHDWSGLGRRLYQLGCGLVASSE